MMVGHTCFSPPPPDSSPLVLAPFVYPRLVLLFRHPICSLFSLCFPCFSSLFFPLLSPTPSPCLLVFLPPSSPLLIPPFSFRLLPHHYHLTRSFLSPLFFPSSNLDPFERSLAAGRVAASCRGSASSSPSGGVGRSWVMMTVGEHCAVVHKANKILLLLPWRMEITNAVPSSTTHNAPPPPRSSDPGILLVVCHHFGDE
eukprot:GHVU01045653.1.p1 GENE.GHVU01045653.1~~GHVU01045653.1.p1  ORF type:complete len:199 (-),score=5.74 GHVU01045653.1:327-923(-)